MRARLCRHSLESASSQSEVTRIAPEACTQLVRADALIMLPSFFSYAAALLSNASRIYHLPMVGNRHLPLPHWRVWCSIKYSAVSLPAHGRFPQKQRILLAAVPINHTDQYSTKRPYVGWDLAEVCPPHRSP